MDWVNLFDWVQTVAPEQLPDPPWELAPCCMVVGNARFLTTLQGEAAHSNPKNPRFKYGRLHDELRATYQAVENKSSGVKLAA